MPGGHLSETERSLASRWNQPGSYPYPLLRAISIQGDTGLRGIQNQHLELKYPLSVLIGRNGTGKSTLLALAALAFHSPSGHVPVNALRKPSGKEPTSYYTFSDFFFRGPGDASTTGVEISWEYSGRPSLTVRRRSDKWMRYERRPRRPVHFVGIARTVPAIERRVLRAHFPPTASSVATHDLEPLFVQYLSRITGLNYAGAQVLTTDRYQLRAVQGRQAYSSFNMGAGEDLIVEILHVIQSAPKGSLIVIEEVELGLHPRAVKEFAAVLLELAQTRSLQFVVSSHSYEFIDSVPRQARVLLQRVHQEVGPTHHLTYGPTTRLVMGELAGEAHHEATVYCEDEFAKQLLDTALAHSVRSRVKILAVGSATELARYARFHGQTGTPGEALIVWDGDVSDALIRTWLDATHGQNVHPMWRRLPGTSAPERWVAGVLSRDPGTATVARLLNADPAGVRLVMEELLRMGDHHDLAWEFGRRYSRERDVARTIMLLAACEAAPDELADVREAVAAVVGPTATTGQR